MVSTTRQICQCIRALIAGEQTACRFAVAYEGAGVVWGVAWSVASALNGVTLLVGTRSGVAPKAPLKGELAARNALSEGFCGRASGAWRNNALPTSLLLRKTSQSASLTAPLSGEPLAFAALRVTTSSVALVDAVGRRPRWSCVTAAVRKRKRSGERFAHQVGRRMQSQACLVPRTVCGCSPDPHPRGGSLGRDLPP